MTRAGHIIRLRPDVMERLARFRARLEPAPASWRETIERLLDVAEPAKIGRTRPNLAAESDPADPA